MNNTVFKTILRASKVFTEMRKHVVFSVLTDGLVGFLQKHISLFNHVRFAKVEKRRGDRTRGRKSDA